MDYILVTNNSQCRDYYASRLTVEYTETWSYLDVLLRVRDLVHRGAYLVTHPMAGSLKPNQTPYRSVVLSRETLEDKEPWQDVILVESSLDSLEKFFRCRKLPDWPENIKRDFRTLDLSFVRGALKETTC